MLGDTKKMNAPLIIVIRIGHIHVGNGNPDDPGQSVEVYLVRTRLERTWKSRRWAYFTKLLWLEVKHLKNLGNCRPF